MLWHNRETRDCSTGLEAKLTIPEGVAIALYSCLICLDDAQLDRHDLSLGAQILKYLLKIDGSQVTDCPQTGQMQLANHACLHPFLCPSPNVCLRTSLAARAA